MGEIGSFDELLGPVDDSIDDGGEFVALPDRSHVKAKLLEAKADKSGNENLVIRGTWEVTGLSTELQANGEKYSRRLWDNGSLFVFPKTSRQLAGQPEETIKSNERLKKMWSRRIGALGIDYKTFMPSDLSVEAFNVLAQRMVAEGNEVSLYVGALPAGEPFKNRDGEMVVREKAKNFVRDIDELTPAREAKFAAPVQMETPF